jgi:enoyl-CoA hydratase/carnithine racemase
MEKHEFITVEREDPVLTITLNRPQKMNAISLQMWDEIDSVYEELKQDRAIRYVIFSGAGESFSAGDDIKIIIEEFQSAKDHDAVRYHQYRSHEIKNKILNMEQITIAAIKGYCLGAGLGLAILCDFRVATPSAKLGIPETKVGLFYTWGLTHHMNRLVGPAVTKDMIMTSRVVDADEGLRVGLIGHLVPEEKLMDKVYELIELMEGNGPNAIRLTKKLVNASTAPQIGDLMVMEPDFVQYQYLSGEAVEGIGAFVEKRKPKWHTK